MVYKCRLTVLIQHQVGQLYTGYYSKPKIAIAADHAKEVAAKHNINGHAAALRWTTFHSLLDGSKGDAVIVGASSVAQLSANLDIIDQGPLPHELVEVLDGVHGQLGDEAIPYHM